MVRKLQPKSVFASSTIQGTILTTFSTILLAILPSVQRIIDNHVQNEQTKRDVQEIIFIVNTVFTILGIGGAGTAVAGRVSIGDLWTPRGIPGPNEEDLNSSSRPERVELKMLPPSPDASSEVQLETQHFDFGGDESNTALSSSGEINPQSPPASLLEDRDELKTNLITSGDRLTEPAASTEPVANNEPVVNNIPGSDRLIVSPKRKKPTYWSSKKNSSTS